MTPLEAAFTRYGITYPRRTGKIRCPLGVHEDQHPSATLCDEADHSGRHVNGYGYVLLRPLLAAVDGEA